MSTTITPMINPDHDSSAPVRFLRRAFITATQRASSSSQKSCDALHHISPMLPLRSPTRSMRAATGVVEAVAFHGFRERLPFAHPGAWSAAA